ncbi:MAG: hypothetical protein ACRCYO_14190, partial [Bacteroidia bacterium]
SLEKALQKAETLFPKGSRVQFRGQYSNSLQEGTGTVTGYNSNPDQTTFVRIVVQSELGRKEFAVADPDDDFFEHDSSRISLMS